MLVAGVGLRALGTSALALLGRRDGPRSGWQVAWARRDEWSSGYPRRPGATPAAATTETIRPARPVR
jgi:hypothetical protein